jgi:chemotaxis response regulator CheB
MVHEMAKRLNGNDARQANLVAASANDVADDTLVESEVDPEFPSDSNFPMVGIVASAGGLDALKHFLQPCRAHPEWLLYWCHTLMRNTKA